MRLNHWDTVSTKWLLAVEIPVQTVSQPLCVYRLIFFNFFLVLQYELQINNQVIYL